VEGRVVSGERDRRGGAGPGVEERRRERERERERERGKIEGEIDVVGGRETFWRRI